MAGGHETTGGRLSGRMYAVLKDRLVEGDFSAGSRISIEALRQEYGMSKQPLMEAFRLLSADGIVEIVPQVGCRPVVYSEQEVADFFRVFAASEGAVAAAAAKRRSPAQLDALRQALSSTAALEDVPDLAARGRRYREANREFHELIQEMAGSRVIGLVSRRMWDLSDYLVSTFTGSGFGEHVSERHHDHEVIVAALQASDPEGARDAMQEHILHTVQLLGVGEAGG